MCIPFRFIPGVVTHLSQMQAYRWNGATQVRAKSLSSPSLNAPVLGYVAQDLSNFLSVSLKILFTDYRPPVRPVDLMQEAVQGSH